MFVDSRALPDGSLIESDVCIVGAGAAGITIARDLRALPLRVTLLESGWLSPDEATQSLYAGEVKARSYFPLGSVRTRTRYFGGSTNEWTGECRPLDAQDFEQRDWVSDSGWPFDFAHLLPFYEKAQALCQLGPFAYSVADWRERGVRPIAFQSESVCTHAFHYSPPTRFGEVYREESRRRPMSTRTWERMSSIWRPQHLRPELPRSKSHVCQETGFGLQPAFSYLPPGGSKMLGSC